MVSSRETGIVLRLLVIAVAIAGCSSSSSSSSPPTPHTTVAIGPTAAPATAGAELGITIPEFEPWSRPEIDTDISGAIRIEIGDVIADIVHEAPVGSTFVIASGRHIGQSVTPRSGDVFLGEPGAILDGDFSKQFAISAHDLDNPVTDVVIRGIIFERYDTPVQLGMVGGGGGYRWLFEGNEIRYSRAAGIEVGSGSIVRNNFIHHNEQIGVHIGSPTADVIIEDNEISFNNFEDEYDMAWEAGGSKFVFTVDLLVKGNYVHDNRGAGLWTDGDNIGTVYEGNTVIDNAGPGIFHEISYDAVVRNNVVIGNATDFYTGGILIANSSNVTVTNNVLQSNQGGIVAIQDDRGEGSEGVYSVEGLQVYNNSVAITEGWSGLRVNSRGFDVNSVNTSFEDNRYEAPGGYDGWFWGKAELNFEQWRELGFDASSTLNGES